MTLETIAYIATPTKGRLRGVGRLVFANTSGHRNTVMFGDKLEPLVKLSDHDDVVADLEMDHNVAINLLETL